jgi:hypothetical protein
MQACRTCQSEGLTCENQTWNYLGTSGDNRPVRQCPVCLHLHDRAPKGTHPPEEER